jgi:hypothetical protein
VKKSAKSTEDGVEVTTAASKAKRARRVGRLRRDAARVRVERLIAQCACLKPPLDHQFFAERPDGRHLLVAFGLEEWKWTKGQGLVLAEPLTYPPRAQKARATEYRYSTSREVPLSTDREYRKANSAYCRFWVERWDELIGALRDSGDAVGLGALKPSDLNKQTMHALFLRRADGEPQNSVARTLATLREGTQPARSELKELKSSSRRAQGELGRYFVWLRRQLRLAWFAESIQAGPISEARARTTEPPRRASDYAWLTTGGGKRYVFPQRRQREVIRALWETWESSGRRDGSGLTTQAIAEAIEANRTVVRLRIDKIFGDHEVLADRVLARTSRGIWALHLDPPAPHSS